MTTKGNPLELNQATSISLIEANTTNALIQYSTYYSLQVESE